LKQVDDYEITSSPEYNFSDRFFREWRQIAPMRMIAVYGMEIKVKKKKTFPKVLSLGQSLYATIGKRV
jgi:hypothetical protein